MIPAQLIAAYASHGSAIHPVSTTTRASIGGVQRPHYAQIFHVLKRGAA